MEKQTERERGLMNGLKIGLLLAVLGFGLLAGPTFLIGRVGVGPTWAQSGEPSFFGFLPMVSNGNLGAPPQAETATPPPSPTVEPSNTPTAAPTFTPPPINGEIFVETFDGDPSAPTAWTSLDWDLTIHQRDQDRLYEMLPMAADHGPGCEPPPQTHTITAFEDNFFICKNHMMTANYGASNNGGYGMVYFTPARLLDTTGDFYIQYDMSTYRVNNNRNWVDVWITPYDKNLQLTLNEYWPDLEGPPTEGIQIQLVQQNMLLLRLHENGVETDLQPIDFTPYHDVLTMDKKQRTTFYIGVDGGQLKIGLPEHNLWWYDQPAPDMFRRESWQQTVVQFGHHSYTPSKGCEFSYFPADCAAVKADTFHWDNMMVAPVAPFDLVQGSPRLITDSTVVQTFIPARPAPANAHLRFGGIGNNLEVSFDNGISWQAAVKQAHTKTGADEHFGSFWMPIPAGTTSVQFRGENWWAGEWAVRDISIWARD